MDRTLTARPSAVFFIVWNLLPQDVPRAGINDSCELNLKLRVIGKEFGQVPDLLICQERFLREVRTAQKNERDFLKPFELFMKFRHLLGWALLRPFDPLKPPL